MGARGRRRVVCEAGETGGCMKRAVEICEWEHGGQIVCITGGYECELQEED